MGLFGLKSKKVRLLTVHEGKDLLREAEFPVNDYYLAHRVEEAVKFAENIGFPVALKIVSPEILHKTEVGGIILNLESKEEVSEAFETLMQRIKERAPSSLSSERTGIAVEEMVKEGVETIIGGFTDDAYGKIIMFGLGGIFVELLQDVSFRLAPIDELDAQEMLEEVKGSKILEGYRGKGPYDVERLIKNLVRASSFFVERKEITEFDLNPLFVLPIGRGVKIVDVRLLMRD